jgi:D-alanine-D-alanine ligase
VNRLRVGVLFGGRSAEHEVSLRSAASVIAAMDRTQYEIVPIKIGRDGRWELPSAGSHDFLEGLVGDEVTTVAFLTDPTSPGLLEYETSKEVWKRSDRRVDVFFPVLHGTNGEDGTLQGMFEMAGVAFVGAGAAASAACMDKAYMKSILREHELPVVEDLVVFDFEWASSTNEVVGRIEKKLSYPVFTKPANLGSSVGVSKVRQRGELGPALEEAFRYDRKTIVEQGLEAREIECSLLGNDEPVASLPGEIVPSGEFYDYRAKYIDDDSELIIPASLSQAEVERVQALGRDSFRALDVSGMARVDFLLERSSHDVYVNELNTIPGFTSISMYPKLWEATGLEMARLIDRLIELALEKAKSRAGLQTWYAGETA